MSDRQRAIMPLMGVIVLDALGIVIVYPVFALLFAADSPFLVIAGWSQHARDICYGLTLALYPLGMLFGAPFLGDLSDAWGRKRVLLLCLCGTLVGFVLSALAIMYHSLWLLLLGRALDGFTAASQPIAQAAIVDISDERNKTRNLAWIVFAIYLGMVLGPMVGGVFSELSIDAHLGLALPFWVAALLSWLNIVALWLTFQETYHVKPAKLDLCKGLNLFAAAFTHQGVRRLVIVFLLSQLAWLTYYQMMPLYLVQYHQYFAVYIGLFLAVIGVLSCVGLTVLLPRLEKRCLPERILKTALLCLGVSFVLVAALFQFSVPQWLLAMLIGMVNAIYTAAIYSQFSGQVDASAQGWVMGVTAAVSAFSFALTGVLIGLFSMLSPELVMLAMAGLVLLARSVFR